MELPPPPQPASVQLSPQAKAASGVVGGLALLGLMFALLPHSHTPAQPTYSGPSYSSSGSSYDQGAADWRALKSWFATQSGDSLAGANWWSSNRSRPNQGCSDASDEYGSTTDAKLLFFSGCRAAQNWLAPIDARRRSDPQYRSGFNDEAKRNP